MSEKRAKVSTPDFVNVCDNHQFFDEVANKLNLKEQTVQQRYYQLNKKFPGLFEPKSLRKRSKNSDVLAEIAAVRGLSKEELSKKMLERVNNLV